MRLRTLAVVVTGICVPLTAVFVILATGHSRPSGAALSGGVSSVLLTASAFVFALVGRLVMDREPGNRVGPVLLITGLALGLSLCAGVYASYAVFVAHREAALAIVLYNVLGPPPFGLLGVVLLLFPDGRLPSRRWRFALAISLTGIAAIVMGYLFRPGGGDPPFETVENPLGIAGAFDLFDAMTGFGWLLMGIGDVLAAIAMVGRLRRATGV
jgi:hypothetical protein